VHRAPCTVYRVPLLLPAATGAEVAVGLLFTVSRAIGTGATTPVHQAGRRGAEQHYALLNVSCCHCQVPKYAATARD